MTSKLKCPFCEYELQENRTTNLCCPICGLVAPTKLWQALIQSQQQLKLLEPIVASLQGRADINAEIAQDSNELVVQWYEKYEQSQKDLEKAIGAFEYILEKIKISKIVDPNDITIMMIEGMCEMTLEQIEHKE